MRIIKSLALPVAMVVLVLATAAPAHAGRRRSVTMPVVHVNGTISAVGTNSITVNGVDFTIDSNTKIVKDDAAITAADLAVGDKVNVKGVAQNGTNLATNIEVETDDESGGDDATATANGIVTAVGAGSLTVHRANGQDVTVNVSTTTTITKLGLPIGFADIKVGDRVEARGTRVDDHTIAAVAIEVETQDNHGEHEGATASGTVMSKDTSSLVVMAPNGVKTTVQFDASTKITKKGTAITAGDIKVGDHVEAEGSRVDDHTILATKITVEDPQTSGHH